MTLVKRTFILFLSAFLLQTVLLLGLIYFGYTHSEGQWKTLRIAAIEETARQILLSDDPPPLPQEIPITIYDNTGSLAASNRGIGRGRIQQENELRVLKDGGRVIGYYSTGQISFRSSSSSRELIDTMVTVLSIGLLLALGISLAAAAYFSRKLSRPAQRISSSLEDMIKGNSQAKADEKGFEEIAAIARSVNTLQESLQHEQVIRSQWAQDIAHDLRTPTASMKAQFEAMLDGVFPVTTERIQKASKELYRMEMLIHDLETLMKLESPEMHLNISSIDSQQFIQELSARFPDALSPVNSDPFQFHADEQLLYRAVSNLISNAVRHAQSGTSVSVRIEKTDRHAEISVHNYGTPIPQHEIPRVFDRLFRGEFARNTPGSGLGLTIVKRIAELHNGSADIVSSEEHGTEACIRIPLDRNR